MVLWVDCVMSLHMREHVSVNVRVNDPNIAPHFMCIFFFFFSLLFLLTCSNERILNSTEGEM